MVWARSSAVERSVRIRKVTGSNPAESTQYWTLDQGFYFFTAAGVEIFSGLSLSSSRLTPGMFLFCNAPF